MQYLIIAGSSAVVYIFLIVFIRLFGKKEFSQLSIFDLVFILLISNAVQNAMLNGDTSFIGGLCSAITLFIVNYIFKYVIYRYPKISEFVQGNPMMLIYDGEVLDENLRKAKLSISEIEEAVREHGVLSIEDVCLAVLEMDGKISILTNGYSNRSGIKKKGINN